MKLFVANIPFDSTDEDIRELFEPFGRVGDCHVARDKGTQKSKGYAFVEMAQPQAIEAIAALDGKYFRGRKLDVQQSTAPPPRYQERRVPHKAGLPTLL